jgi:uncharacterized protein (DUF305 family)
MQRTFTTRRALAAGIAAFAALTLAACGGGGDDMDGMDHGSDAESETGEDFNDADVTFAQMMIPHHQQAVEMSELAEAQAADPEVIELAGQIKAAQQPEIDTLTGLLEGWGEPVEMEGHEGMSMGGMMTEDQMAELEAAQGAEFDALFVHHMIAHHEGAVEMAQTEIADGQNAEAKALAEAVVETQTAEIATLEGIMARLG